MVKINEEFWKNRISQFNKDIDLSIKSNDMYILSNAYLNELVKQQSKNIDNMYCEFLEENGYKIDKPYNIEQLNQIKEDLAKQDKFIDYLKYTEFADNCSKAYHYIMPFFNCISNPLSEEYKQELLEKWKEKNDRKGSNK